MKKILIVLVAIIAAGGSASGQGAPYRPWSEFNRDTLFYLKANFHDNKARYIGQKLEKVLNDYELPLKDAIVFPSNKAARERISLLYVDSDDEIRYYYQKIPLHVVRVKFVEPTAAPPSPYVGLTLLPPPREYAMQLKDAIVADVEVVTKGPTTPYKPQPLSQFNGDALSYLQYNLLEHKDYFVGKLFLGTLLIFNQVNFSIEVIPDQGNYVIGVLLSYIPEQGQPYVFKVTFREELYFELHPKYYKGAPDYELDTIPYRVGLKLNGVVADIELLTTP